MNLMNARFKRSLWRCATFHALIVLIFLATSFLHNLKKPKQDTPKMVTYVDFQPTMPESLAIVPVKEINLPEQRPDVPIRQPKEKKKINVNKKRVKKQNAREFQKESRPSQELTQKEIKKLLAAETELSTPSNPQKSDLPSWYYALARQTLDQAWQQPNGLSLSDKLTATVLIRVQRNGLITKRDLIRPSGHAVLDESVMQAVQSVTHLKPFPHHYEKAYKDITVDFQLTM